MPGYEWGFKSSTENGQVQSPRMLAFATQDVSERLNQAGAKRDNFLNDALDEHTRYWNTTDPGAAMEHWRYADGWDLGWKDSREFFSARISRIIPSLVTASFSSAPVNGKTLVGADFIDALELWVLKRMRECGATDTQRFSFGWEFKHGFRRAVRDFQSITLR